MHNGYTNQLFYMPYLNWIDDSDLQNEVKNLLEKANLAKISSVNKFARNVNNFDFSKFF